MIFFKKIIFFVLFLFFCECRASLSNLDKDLFYNKDYTGFITRDFFQVVVEVPYSFHRESLINLRKKCKEDSVQKRDQIVFQVLNQTRTKQKKQPIRSELFQVQYQWFFNQMFLFFEDYSQKKTCKFVYRVLEENLFEKVMEVK